jgi:hypothetical protein
MGEERGGGGYKMKEGGGEGDNAEDVNHKVGKR